MVFSLPLGFQEREGLNRAFEFARPVLSDRGGGFIHNRRQFIQVELHDRFPRTGLAFFLVLAAHAAPSFWRKSAVKASPNTSFNVRFARLV